MGSDVCLQSASVPDRPQLPPSVPHSPNTEPLSRKYRPKFKPPPKPSQTSVLSPTSTLKKPVPTIAFSSHPPLPSSFKNSKAQTAVQPTSLPPPRLVRKRRRRTSLRPPRRPSSTPVT